MFVITNRALRRGEGLDVFDKMPNPSGPNELRMVRVDGVRNPQVTVLDDKLSQQQTRALADKFKLNIDTSAQWYASLQVACDLFETARRQKKHILLFVHGYNNDMDDVLKTARELERLYNVLAVPFSWPANGRNKISGTLSYRDDKEDARASATALHRAVQKLGMYHHIMTEGIRLRLFEQASTKHPADHERALALFGRLLERECKTSVNLLCHSMGNYLLKYALTPSGSSLRELSFDNIALVAADTNNPGHNHWVQSLPVRNRLYVVINENDYALRWSRRKPGDAQKERLGHHLRNLCADNAYYLDVTRSKGVGKDHSYFRGKAVQDNATLRRMFARIFEGDNAEAAMDYHVALNVYRS